MLTKLIFKNIIGDKQFHNLLMAMTERKIFHHLITENRRLLRVEVNGNI